MYYLIAVLLILFIILEAIIASRKHKPVYYDKSREEEYEKELEQNSEIFTKSLSGKERQELIMKLILKNIKYDVSYEYLKGISKEEYELTEYELYNSFYSSDFFTTNINKQELKLAKVFAGLYSILDHDRSLERPAEQFSGLVAYYYPKHKIPYTIYIRENRKFYLELKRFKMKNKIFDKKVKLYSDEPEIMEKIFTPEVNLAILKFLNTTNIKFRMFVVDDVVYFRFYTRVDTFEFCYSKKELSRQMAMTEFVLQNIFQLIELLANQLDKVVSNMKKVR